MPPVADLIDVEALLAPIPGENPGGEDVRRTLYDEVKEARRSDDGLEQGIWKQDVKNADWGNVVRLTRDALLQADRLLYRFFLPAHANARYA